MSSNRDQAGCQAGRKRGRSRGKFQLLLPSYIFTSLVLEIYLALEAIYPLPPFSTVPCLVKGLAVIQVFISEFMSRKGLFLSNCNRLKLVTDDNILPQDIFPAVKKIEKHGEYPSPNSSLLRHIPGLLVGFTTPHLCTSVHTTI